MLELIYLFNNKKTNFIKIKTIIILAKKTYDHVYKLEYTTC